MCGGGGSSKPTQQTVTQVTIPPELMPYAKRALGTAEQLTYQQPYQTYGGQRLAGLNPLQQQGMFATQALGPSQQIEQASGLASLAGAQAGQLGQSFQPLEYQPLGVSYLGVGSERFGTPQMQEYMSPFMTGVVEQQKQAAVQDYARQIPGLQAQGIRAGARGGTREALLQSEAQRNLQQQLGGIEATGRQQAFQQAAQQFGADRAAAMQAQQLNQAAQLQAQQQALGQNQAAQQMMEQSRQFGAGFGLQGLQQQLAAAGTLGQLGQQQFAQRQAAAQAQQQAGTQLQQLEQARLQMAYEDFLNRQRYPYQQLGFMSDLIRGTPTAGGVEKIYGSTASPIGALAGLGGLYMAGRTGGG